MSVDPFKEALEATVSPVQVNPLTDAQAQDHIILRSLRHEKIIVV